MDFIMELIGQLWVKLAAHLKNVLPEQVWDGIVAKIPMPISE